MGGFPSNSTFKIKTAKNLKPLKFLKLLKTFRKTIQKNERARHNLDTNDGPPDLSVRRGGSQTSGKETD